MSVTSVAQKWVSAAAGMTQPSRVTWCDGSKAEYDSLIDTMLQDGTLLPLNPKTYPNCYLHRSHPSDVARTEQLTFICSRDKDSAGPTNNWIAPIEAKSTAGALFRGSMRGRTMWVIPYLMGPAGSPMSRVGLMVTDSQYVVASMHLMTRVGSVAIQAMRRNDDFIAGLHSLGDLSPERRLILHFPEEKLIWSVGSGYGGNALLGKKCHALRIASAQAREEGWLAEHMLIVGVESPEGETHYIAAALPSACGKTNLAMLVPPPSHQGWKVWTVGDDMAWIRPGADGRLWAINPEAGFFGVAPGTSSKTNPNAMATLRKNSIFTNVAVTEDGCPWWEGIDGPVPERLTDWRGRPWQKGSSEKAAHPNSRFTAPAWQCPSISPRFEDPQGVPISAVVFGGRRARTAPLVLQAFDWSHGVFVGASVASETTAAQSGAVGVVRRDPMAMLPFCGYNMADYFGHWLEMGKTVERPPAIFHVNWFRQDAGGRFIWPGFGENLRVLRWIVARCKGVGAGTESPIGLLPAKGAIDTTGLAVDGRTMEELLSVPKDDWRREAEGIGEFFGKFDGRLPAEMERQRQGL